ncbi:hypothetical protein HHL25_22335 [Rhizobium sp. S-51]|uniref:Uncharacterized protein n=1 Tax=Rhizobium terricola TaxID=2728849 RepID=A0A7Y0B0F9_9HYPH|nr:hypothetical protein [Rhizobium terricola]NML76884.1 hypothetical protein [Rhizobium terricola]
MVTVRRFSVTADEGTYRQGVLMRLLRRAAYSTGNLAPMAGGDFAAERTAIRQIKAAMIGLEDYPATRDRNQAAETEAWEQEGGSVEAEAVKRLPSNKEDK